MSVYFLAGVGQDIVKIGWSKRDAQSRCGEIQRMSPIPLKILLIQHNPGTLKAEQELHKTFKDQRLWGEWFRLSGPVQDYIDEYTDAGRRHTEFESCLDIVDIYFSRESLPAYISSVAKNNTDDIIKKSQQFYCKVQDLRILHAGVASLSNSLGQVLESQKMVADGMYDPATDINRDSTAMRAATTIQISSDAIRSLASSYAYQQQKAADHADYKLYRHSYPLSDECLDHELNSLPRRFTRRLRKPAKRYV